MTDSSEVVVMPMRFTDHMPQMQEFLSLLGFSRRVSRAESWADFAGDSGLVALHSVATTSDRVSGETSLSFEVADADTTTAVFTDAGYSAEIYDEAYGRVIRVTDHDGAQLYFNEQDPELYGYRFEEPRPEHGIVAMPVRFVPPTGPFTDLLTAAGFLRLDEGDDQWWRVWGAEGGGLVALHPATEDWTLGSVRLGFRTREPLTELAERLAAAGFADATVPDEYGGELTVTDPDGQSVLIQPVESS